jgi:hypothetical protein
MPPAVKPRRFPPPWSVEELLVRDHSVAANVAKLPELLRKA